MISDSQSDDANGFDPTGSTSDMDYALVLINLREMIDDVAQKYPEAKALLPLLAAGLSKKEIFERYDFSCQQSQAYARISKIQKELKKLYHES